MALSEFVKFRVHADELTHWRTAAEATGLTLSSWLRGMADLAAANEVDPVALRAELVALRTALNRGVGNNLNQLMMAIHSRPAAQRSLSANQLAALQAATGDIATMRKAIENALRGLCGPKRTRRRRPKGNARGRVAAPETVDFGFMPDLGADSEVVPPPLPVTDYDAVENVLRIMDS